MLDVLAMTGVIFLLIAVGYAVVQWGTLSASDLKVLGVFVVNFAMPALIFKAVSTRDLTDVFDPVYLALYVTASLATFALAYGSSRKLFAQTRTEATFNGMGVSCANSGFIGYPIFLIALPSLAGTILTLNMMVENFVMIPLVLFLAERAARHGIPDTNLATQVTQRLLRNPLLIAMIAALIVSISSLPIPGIVTNAVDLIAASSAALSLIVIGGTLVGLDLRAINVKIISITTGKLLLMPAAAVLAIAIFKCFGLTIADPRLEQALIISAAIPPMAIYPILAQAYGAEKDAALAMALMTAVSFVTLTGVMWLFPVAG
ncbi:AEC family transporter [Roseibium sp.]|uniref:AEC family transporter n=1 Tax=Roseibium sp. TaxID=1936156 RepID=UPI003A971B72